MLCLNPAFCVSGLSRYNHHPNTVFVFFSLVSDFYPLHRIKNQNKLFVFVCWFRLSNLLKIDAFDIAIYCANQNELIIISAFCSWSSVMSPWMDSVPFFRFDLYSIGGGKRDWTDDPLLAKHVLYQLSYAPVLGGSGSDLNLRPHAYSILSFNQLSYNA